MIAKSVEMSKPVMPDLSVHWRFGDEEVKYATQMGDDMNIDYTLDVQMNKMGKRDRGQFGRVSHWVKSMQSLQVETQSATNPHRWRTFVLSLQRRLSWHVASRPSREPPNWVSPSQSPPCNLVEGRTTFLQTYASAQPASCQMQHQMKRL